MGANTVKRLAILTTVVVLLGLALFFLQRYQVERMVRTVLARAEEAEQNKEYVEAAKLYREHLVVVPGDVLVQKKFADALLLSDPKSPDVQKEAAGLYESYVNRNTADIAALRRLAELHLELSQYESALRELEGIGSRLKLDKGGDEPTDGDLDFLMGRCEEGLNLPDRALKSYQRTIAHQAPQRLEAYWRVASLLRKQADRLPAESSSSADALRKQADQAIRDMVQTDKDNYLVYLHQGRYLRQFELTKTAVGDAARQKIEDEARKALAEALRRNPRDAQIYIELAALEMSRNNTDAARKVITAGLRELPEEPALHLELANLESAGSSGSIEKAIASLRRSLEELPNQPVLRLRLAELLAQNRETNLLDDQIEKLQRMNLRHDVITLLEAQSMMGARQWGKALIALNRVQLGEQSELLKSQAQCLMAQCYAQLGDRPKQLQAYRSAIAANPQNPQARLGLATALTSRGDLDGAVKEYQELLNLLTLGEGRTQAQIPLVRSQLARVLIARNQTKAPADQDWSPMEKLIQAARDSNARSSEWVILRSEMLLAQNKDAATLDLLMKQRTDPSFQDPQGLWLKSAEVLTRQRHFTEARKILDEAQNKLGDSTSLRLERARLVVSQGGAELPAKLAELADNLGSFPAADSRALLRELAQQATRLNLGSLAADLWSRLGGMERDELEPKLRLLDLALRGKNGLEIENRLNEIKRIDGNGLQARYGEARYLVWQAANTTEPAKQEELRRAAQSKLEELRSNRTDAPPKAKQMLADLYIARLARTELSGDEKRTVLLEAARLYREIVDGGQTDLNTLRGLTSLYYAAGDKAKAQELWLTVFQNAGANDGRLLLQGAVEALRNGDKDGARGAGTACQGREPCGSADLLRAGPDAHGQSARRRRRSGTAVNRRGHPG